MSLARKTLVIIMVLLAFQLLTFYLLSRAFFFRNFAHLEEQYARRNLERAQASIESSGQSFLALVKDWAAWDDTYYFIQEPTEEYIRSNVVDETFEGLQINLILFLGSSGELVFGKAYDLSEHREVPLPEGWKDHFHAGSPLLSHPGPTEGKTGIIILPSGPMFIALHPIVTSQEKGPIMGTLVMGYYLDQAWAERLSRVVYYPVSLLTLIDPRVPPELAKGEAFAVRTPDAGTLEAFALLNDIYGKPALVLKITMPRELYRQSRSLFLQFSLLIFLIAAMFGGTILLFLRQHLLSRLTRLSDGLRAIAASGNISARLAVEGKDELTELGKGINSLLTSLEESHRALEERERWYRLLVNSITDGLWVVDRNLNLRQVNETGARLLGLEAEKLPGKSLEECLKEPALSDFREAFNRAVERNAIQTISTLFPAPEGEKVLEIRLYPFSLTPPPEDPEQRRGALCIVRDITELRQMERLYLRAQRIEAAGRLALAIAHDFNNFLTPILASTELLLSGTASASETRALLEEIRRACEKASALVKKLLLFGRAEPLAPEILNLNAVILEMQDLIVRTLGRDIEFMLDLAPDLYPVRADKGHVEQILINLVMNAKDAMPGGGQLLIKTENVRLEEGTLAHPEAYPGEFVCLTVKDTGVGISPEVMEHIFDPFFTTKESGIGTGLGLSVVYSIVKQLNGWIEVRSKPGEGATFFIYFPASDHRRGNPWS